MFVKGPTGKPASLEVDADGQLKTTGSGGGGGGGASTIADGADEALGSTTDAAVFVGEDGTALARLRGIQDTLDETIATAVTTTALALGDPSVDGTVIENLVAINENVQSLDASLVAIEVAVEQVSTDVIDMVEATNAILDARLAKPVNSVGGLLPIDFDYLAETYGYTGDNLTTIVKTNGVNTWTQTLAYTGARLDSISKWVQT